MADHIDARLKTMGHTNGIGREIIVESKKTNLFYNPLLYFSDNINGGNSPEPVVLGNLIFVGDEALVRKEGFVSGFSFDLNGRLIYANDRYLRHSASVTYVYSPEHKLGIRSAAAKVCNFNHLTNWWYLDACAETLRISKDMTDETKTDVSLGASKFFAIGDHIYNQTSFKLNRHFSDVFTQNQIEIGLTSIHQADVYSSLNVILGDTIKNELSTRVALNGQVSALLAKRRLSISGGFSYSDGGDLFGFERNEHTYKLSVSYPIWDNLRLSVGYRETDSSIDYFDVSTPTFHIQLGQVKL